jgi:iron complex transport system substrate-binding protein
MPWGNCLPVAELGHREHTRFIVRRLRVACFASLALLALMSRTSGAAISVEDDRGTVIRLAAAPKRIVSLLPSLTETVCALGACGRLVGTDRFSNWPESVAALPKLGGMEDAQIERIVALKPDAVLVEMSSRATPRLESLGVHVVALRAKTRADVKRTLGVLGRILDASSEAERVWASIERDVQAAAARVPLPMRGKRVYFEVDSAPYAAGPSSFIGETLAQLGLGNVVPKELGPFPKLNPEFVVRAQPDVIIAVASAVTDMPRRPGWSSLRALSSGATCALPTARYELVIHPGPRMGEAAAVIVDCLAAITSSITKAR